MNEQQKEEIKNSDLVEAETFSQAIASRDELIAKKNETIRILKKQIGEQQKTISGHIEAIDNEKTSRIEAENLVTHLKSLEKQSIAGGKYVQPKSSEERFADFYRQATQKIRTNRK